MMEKQTVCLRQLGGDRAGEVKLGRWFANEKITQDELIRSRGEKVATVVAGRHVLLIQDTTEVNYQSHVHRVQGLGLVGNGKDVGFFLHPMLVLDAEEGTCLGLGAMKVWSREKGKIKNNYKRLPIEEKESYRWLEVAAQSKAQLDRARMMTIIADRESDIYEEWCRLPDEKTYILTRACRNRTLRNKKLLFQCVQQMEVRGIYELEVRPRMGKRSGHRAQLEIRFGDVEIKKPGNCKDKAAHPSVTLRVVDVKERGETVVGNDAPIHWCLLTTHEVHTCEDALHIVQWYCERWNIEQLFRTLKKQGLNVESSQIETASGLMKLGIIALHVACLTLQLTLAREGREQRVEVVFTEQEGEVLSKIQRTLEGKTQKQKNPHAVGQLSWASWIIARLGGWKGYTCESPPGPITMLRGLRQFQSLLEGYHLAKMCA